MPCISGNSPTISVAGRPCSAGRHAWRAPCRRRCARRSARPDARHARLCRTRCRAGPNTTFFRRSLKRSSGCFLSCLKKNSASVRRGRTTFSLPETICAGSFDSILATVMKRGSSLPLVSSRQKYFWLSCMVEMSASCGTSRKRSSNEQTSGTGHPPAVTSSSSAGGTMALPFCSDASCSTRLAISSRRSAKSAITWAPRRSSV